jgi:hypothetical protein
VYRWSYKENMYFPNGLKSFIEYLIKRRITREFYHRRGSVTGRIYDKVDLLILDF